MTRKRVTSSEAHEHRHNSAGFSPFKTECQLVQEPGYFLQRQDDRPFASNGQGAIAA